MLQHPVSGDNKATAQLPPLLLECDNRAKQVFSLVLHGFMTLTSTPARVHMTGMAVLAMQEAAKVHDGLEYFLTYADNNAVGYFEKQGFTKEVTMDRERVRTPSNSTQRVQQSWRIAYEQSTSRLWGGKCILDVNHKFV